MEARRITGIEADLEEETEESEEDPGPEAAADLVTTEDAEVHPIAPCPEIVTTPETEEARRIEMAAEEKEKRRK